MKLEERLKLEQQHKIEEQRLLEEQKLIEDLKMHEEDRRISEEVRQQRIRDKEELEALLFQNENPVQDELTQKIRETNIAAEALKKELAKVQAEEGVPLDPFGDSAMEDGPAVEEYEPEELEVTLVQESASSENKPVNNEYVDSDDSDDSDDDSEDEEWTTNDEEQQRSRLRKIFDIFDTDKDGLISSRELKDFAEQMGSDVSSVDVHEGFSNIDTDGSGIVNFDTFFSWWAARQKAREMRRSQRSAASSKTPTIPLVKITINVIYRQLSREIVHIYGSIKELGEWDISNSVPLSSTPGNVWTITIEIPADRNSFEYKFLTHEKGKEPKIEELVIPRVVKVTGDAVLNELWEQKENVNVDDIIAKLMSSRERTKELRQVKEEVKKGEAFEDDNTSADSEFDVEDALSDDK